MEWSNYFRTLENVYKIKFDSTLKDTIKNHFTEELNLFTEQDMYEQTRKIVQAYRFSRINHRKIK